MSSIFSTRADAICNAAIPRASYSMIKIIFVTGGSNHESSCLNRVEKFVTSEKKWTCVANMTTVSTACTAVADNDNNIYVLGGYMGDITDATAVVQIYDIVNNSWSMGPVMNQPTAYHGAVFLNNRIYVIGGERYNTNLDRDPDNVHHTGRYLCLRQRAWHYTASMIESRSRVSVCVLNDNIYAVGGMSYEYDDEHDENDEDAEVPVYHNSVEFYDFTGNFWQTIAPMRTARCEAAVTVFEAKIFVFGGKNDSGYLNSAEVYDSSSSSWSDLPSMPVARASGGVFRCKKSIYLFGGCNADDSFLDSMVKFDLNTNSWVSCSETMSGRKSFGYATVIKPYYTL